MSASPSRGSQAALPLAPSASGTGNGCVSGASAVAAAAADVGAVPCCTCKGYMWYDYQSVYVYPCFKPTEKTALLSCKPSVPAKLSSEG